VSQVRKDILNGWKEIGGYVCRDIRTVERWEKQRGLPVRRVPGAGRATVYALISELDEWLANSKPEGKELAADGLDGEISSEPVSRFSSSPQPQWAEGKTVSSPVPEQFPARSATEGKPTLEESGPVPIERRRKPVAAGLPYPAARRRTLIAGVTMAVAASLVCVLAWPLVRSHAKPAVERGPYGLEPGGKSSGAPPYCRSRRPVSARDVLLRAAHARLADALAG